MGKRNFGSKEKYRKWDAFVHIHKLVEKTPGNQDIFIRGKKYKVKH